MWWKIALILGSFGFLKEFRPSEPFISPYLNGPLKNFTEVQINNEIFPVGTYSTVSFLVIVFLVTDWLCYKPVIVLEGICGIITWSLLSWGSSLVQMQIAEVLYGGFIATEIAYSTYMYSKVEKRNYQSVTAYTKAAVLLGKSVSSFTAQILVLYSLMNFQELNYLTLAAMCLATITSLLLPPASQSVYFNKNTNPVETEKVTGLTDVNDKTEQELDLEMMVNSKKVDQLSSHRLNSLRNGLRFLYQDFLSLIKDKNCMKWSLWWILSMCGYLQITYYMQVLWQVIINETGEKVLYHGFSSCVQSLLGALCSYLMGFVKLDWKLYGELLLASCSLLQGCLLLYSSKLSTMLTSYILYAVYKILYQSSYTVCSSEIAKNIKTESYAFVFGVNTFLALVGQSLLTIVLINIMALDIKTQFFIYGCYYLLIGISFVISGVLTISRMITKQLRRTEGPTTNDTMV